MTVVPFIVVVYVERFEIVTEGEYHFHRRCSDAPHFCMSDIKAGDKQRVIHRAEKGREGFRCCAGGGQCVIILFIPVPHIFACYLNAVFLGVGQQSVKEDSILSYRSAVKGMHDAIIGTCGSSAFESAGQVSGYIGIVAGKGGVRLIAYDSVVLTDLFKTADKF